MRSRRRVMMLDLDSSIAERRSAFLGVEPAA